MSKPVTTTDGGYLSIENLMTCLMEEVAEVAKAMSKAKRFGLEDHPPEKSLTNREMIALEIGDVMGVLQIIQREYCDDLRKVTANCAEAKEGKIMINYGKRFAP